MNTDNINNAINKIIHHKSFQNFLIIGSVAVFQLISNVILGRELNKVEFGIYSFIFMNVIRLMSYFFNFGQGASILRYFSSKNLENYKWKKYLRNYFISIIIPIILASYVIMEICDLKIIWFLTIIVGSFILCLINILAALFRSRGYFNIAVMLEQAHPIPFLLMLLLTIFFFNEISLKSSSILKLISFFSSLPFLIYVLLKWKEGDQKVGKKVVTDGFALWEVMLAVIVLNSIDALFITKILNYENLALYTIISSIMQIYGFTTTSLFNIYSQKFSKTRNINAAGFLKVLLFISLVVSVFYILSTNYILYLLFDDKYTASFLLIVLFCIYNSFSLLYVFPSCYLIGHSEKNEMRFMLIINIISIILKIGFIFILKDFGLNGFLMSGIISMAFRTIGGYYMALRKK